MGQGTVQLTTATVTTQTDGAAGTSTTGYVTAGNFNGADLKPAFIPPASVLIPAGSLPLSALARTAATSGQAIEWNGTQWAPATPTLGTVTSVAMTVPGVIFTSPVAGSPITSSGTFALALNTQTANTVFGGPATGIAATPTFRALVAADIPGTLGATVFSSTVAVQDQLFGITGSAAGPSYTFSSATTTGMYRSAADSLGLATNGVTALTIDSAQTVTIPKLSVTTSASFPAASIGVAAISGLAAVATSGSASDLSAGTLPTGRLTVAYAGITGVGTLASGSVPTSLITGLAAVATSGSASDLGSGTLPTGRLTGSYTGITAVGAVTATSLTTGSFVLTGASTGSGFNTTGTDNYFQSNSIRVWRADTSGVFILGSGNGAGMVRSAVTGGVVFVNNASSATIAQGMPSMAYDIDASGTNGSVPNTRSRYITTSRVSAVTRTLPTPANSFVGQIVALVQEASHVVTLGVPSGVTVTMKTGNSLVTGADILTTKTATNFVTSGNAADDGTCATLICLSTDASTVATWRQMGGIGDWT